MEKELKLWIAWVNAANLQKKEYESKGDWVGRDDPQELFKRSKFDYSTKWYMQKPESIRKNEIYKILWDFEIQTDYLIQAGLPNLVLINKQKIFF